MLEAIGGLVVVAVVMSGLVALHSGSLTTDLAKLKAELLLIEEKVSTLAAKIEEPLVPVIPLAPEAPVVPSTPVVPSV